MGGEDLHELRTTGAKRHLLELIAVVEHLAVVVKLESANQRTAVLELVDARTDIHLSLEDVSVGAAIVTRKERYVGQVILSAEIENQSLGQLVRPAVVRMPSARIIVVERVLNRMLASRTCCERDLHRILVLLGVDEGILINRAHLQSGNRLLNLVRGSKNLALGRVTVQEGASFLHGLIQLSVALGRIGIRAEHRGLGDSVLQRLDVRAGLHRHLVLGRLRRINRGLHRDLGSALRLAADVPRLPAGGVRTGNHRSNSGLVGFNREVRITVVLRQDLRLHRGKIPNVQRRLVLTELDGVGGHARLLVVEIDLGDRQHMRTVIGLERLNVDLLDLLVRILRRRREHVLCPHGVIFAAAELLRAVLERDRRRDLLHEAVAIHFALGIATVDKLHILERARLLELERDLHAVDGHHIGCRGPLELEAAGTRAAVMILNTVEQRVELTALNHLRDIRAIVLGQRIVDDGDIEVLLPELVHAGLRNLRQLALGEQIGLDKIALRADKPPSRVLQVDRTVLQRLELERQNRAGPAVQILIALIGKRKVHRAGALHRIQVLHAKSAGTLGNAAIYHLELRCVVVDERTEGVHRAGIVGIHIERNNLTALDLGFIRDQRDAAGHLVGLLGAAVELGHSDRDIVRIVRAVHVEVSPATCDMAVP